MSSEPKQIIYQLNRRMVVQNISALFSGSALAQGFTALIFLLTARHLGAATYGVYTANLALVTISGIIFNLGLDLWLLQSGGRKPETIRAFGGSVLLIKLLLGIVWLIILMLVTPWLDPDTFPPTILLWAALTFLFDSLFLSSLAVFKTKLQNRYPLILEPAADILWLAGTIWLILHNTQEILPFLQVRWLALVIGLVVSIVIHYLNKGLEISPKTAVQALRESPPFAFSEFLAMISMRMDLLIVAVFIGSSAAGIYAPALSLVNTLFFVPAAVTNVMIPVLSNLFSDHPQQAQKTAIRQLFLHAGIGVSLFVGFFLISPLLVRFLGSSYQDSLLLMRILSIILLIKPVSFGMASILVATRNQQRRVIVQTLVAVISIGLDLVAVIFFALPAVAVVYVTTELIMLVGYTWLVNKQSSVFHPGKQDRVKITG
jgi:O-antigen/teichoic acid export membrane protein